MNTHGVNLCAECKRQIAAAAKAHRARVAAKAKPRKEAAKAKRATRNQGTAELRGRLLEITGGYCERCNTMSVPEEGHMHHTEGGGGRVQRQHIGNVAWLCGHCHRFLHQWPKIAKEFRLRIREKRERTGQR